jgi:hypothetical protein
MAISDFLTLPNPRRKHGKRRKSGHSVRRNPGVTGRFMANVKELWSMDTLKNAGFIAAGSVATPILSGIIKGLVNKNKTILPETGLGGAAVNLGVTAAYTAVLGMFIKKPGVVKYMFLGGLAGVISDIAAEQILPRLGLQDYLVGDYLQQGVGAYATSQDVAGAREF